MVILMNRETRLYVYDDFCSWGRDLIAAAKKLGIKTKFFKYSFQVPDKPNVYVFMHILAKRKDRKNVIALSEKIAKKKNIILIPSIHECRQLYDKSLQSKMFGDWMPKTYYIKSKEDAERKINELEYPFISKSKISYASHNVRFIKDKKAAEKEIFMAFSEQGIPMYKDLKQKGYVLWQKFLPNNDYDRRVVIIANKYAYGGKRYNRENVPLASGSDKTEPERVLSDEFKELFDFSLKFSKANDLSLAAIDILKDKNGKYKVIESQCSWGTTETGGDTPIFEYHDGKWIKSKYVRERMFDVFAKAVKEGNFR